MGIGKTSKSIKKRVLNTADLFCGAGGATTGLEDALAKKGVEHVGIAINHWKIAVETMKRNHPAVDTKCMSIEEAVPADLVPGGELDILWASPSCTHHSRAKGGKPRSNQLRAQPELILTWLDQIFVRRLIVENVPEFVDWGPLGSDGLPIKSRVGDCFKAWVAALEARNYVVSWRIVNCADYGDATTRRRFFLKAVRRGCGRITWPEPTYAENPQPELFGERKRWRGIRECLDLADTGKSIFGRKKPLSANTLRRIQVGLKRYCGMEFQMDMLGAGGPDGCRIRSVDEPMVTQHAGGNRVALVKPFLVKLRNHETVEPIDAPITTVTCSGAHHALCTPLVLGQQGGAECRPADEPCPTIATKGAIRVITPFVMDMSHPGDTHDAGRLNGADEPMRTVTTRNNSAAVILPQLEDGRVVDIRIRMLKPSELAAAHSFPPDYELTGTRGDMVKQIGNSVPVRTASAMCSTDIDELIGMRK